jgi:DNA helicase-2/ATP-dependent DNA helicase PcrA
MIRPDGAQRVELSPRNGLLELNAQQQEAVLHAVQLPQSPPLLVIAGAGSGKTKTLAHRVAQLILSGTDPARILLLTFSRRAAQEMVRRARALLQRVAPHPRPLVWAGTFHSIANRLLRLHGAAVGLSAEFTILDRSDAEDLLDIVRATQRIGKTEKRFPRKATCLSIYSRVINAQRPLKDCLQTHFPWCAQWEAELQELFRAYVRAKQERAVLDYDDLLLSWLYLVREPTIGRRISDRFDHILVDEYQDTNGIQAAILLSLRPDGHGVTVVGDDAQAIYSFRGATVRNILDFPTKFTPAARCIQLEQNYRSTEPILNAANAVIALAPERFTKNLFSHRSSAQRPRLVSVEDESFQAQYIIERILEHREAGIALKKQAVLMRAAHHSDLLEVELAHRQIPFVKYGGLRFLESAHVKDLLSILRWAENPRDTIAAFRVVQLLDGIGPALAARVWQHLGRAQFEFGSLAQFQIPPAAREEWTRLIELLIQLRDGRTAWNSQVELCRQWYLPLVERLYDGVAARISDLDQLESIARTYRTREEFLSELALDPPEASGDEAGPPLLDEDYLILSTIHSAKGQEWKVVYVLNVIDGCIPSDMAAGDQEQIEEERRLLYVAITRAKDELYLMQPLRMFIAAQPRFGDRHLYAPRSRFLPDSVLSFFERVSYPSVQVEVSPEPPSALDIPARLRSLWGA